MAGTMSSVKPIRPRKVSGVSMESGLDGRNNGLHNVNHLHRGIVSMESGLDGRNNAARHDDCQ